MAKVKSQRQQDEAALTYKQLARQRRERKQRRQILLAVSVVSALIVVILVVALVNELFVQPSQPVATVNGIDIRTDDFQQRVRYERLMIIQQYLQFSELFGIEQAYQYSGMSLLYAFTETEIQDTYKDFGGQVLDQMIDDELVRQEAAEMGLQVSDDDVSRTLEEQYDYYRAGTPTPLSTYTPRPTATPITSTETSPTPAPTITPRPTPSLVTEQAYEDLYEERLSALEKAGAVEATLRDATALQLLRDKVAEWLMQDVPLEADQVSFEALVFTGPAPALLMTARLEAGELFEDLVAEARENLEGDATVRTSSWIPYDDLVDSFGGAVADAAFALDAGEWSDPITTEDGQVMIVNVSGHEVRELSATTLNSKKSSLYTAWLDGLRESAEIDTYDSWQNRVPQTPALDYGYLIPTAVPTIEE